MSWIDYDKAKANAPKLALFGVAIVVTGIATWGSGRFWYFILGVGIGLGLLVVSLVNYWIRNAKGS